MEGGDEGETRGREGETRGEGGGGEEGEAGHSTAALNNQRGECVIKLCVALLRTKMNEIDASHCIMPQP